METITNAANTAASVASKAIWGDQTATTETTSGTEPVSGEKGDTSQGEPFDKGNSDTATKVAKDTSADDTTTTTNTTTTGPTTKNVDPANTDTTDNTKNTKADPTTAAQGAADPKDEPAPAETDAIKDSKKEAEDAADDSKSSESDGIAAAKKEAAEADKVDVSGPGPKPLSEMHKGEGASGPTGVDDSEGPQKESRGEGTGEKYVKSSGLKAEGGDFDASNPGAGREADRLLEEKGIKREGGKSEAKDGEEGEGAASLDKPGKPSLGERIKAKFHKDKGDK